MVDFKYMFMLKSVDADEIKVFIDLLNKTIASVNQELKLIQAGGYTRWELEHLNDIVLPELTELLAYAKEQKVFFKYGIEQRMLESFYLLTDSPAMLNSTELGLTIKEVQRVYNSL